MSFILIKIKYSGSVEGHISEQGTMPQQSGHCLKILIHSSVLFFFKKVFSFTALGIKQCYIPACPFWPHATVYIIPQYTCPHFILPKMPLSVCIYTPLCCKSHIPHKGRLSRYKHMSCHSAGHSIQTDSHHSYHLFSITIYSLLAHSGLGTCPRKLRAHSGQDAEPSEDANPTNTAWLRTVGGHARHLW